jgi:hypothetical protein
MLGEHVADDGHAAEDAAEGPGEHARGQEPFVGGGKSAGECAGEEADVESEERRPAGKAVQDDRCQKPSHAGCVSVG